MATTCLALFSMPGGTEWLLIGIVLLLLFGRRLPEVARSFGQSIVEFKKGLRDVKDDPAVRDAKKELSGRSLHELTAEEQKKSD